jgi:hypothetical protein
MRAGRIKQRGKKDGQRSVKNDHLKNTGEKKRKTAMDFLDIALVLEIDTTAAAPSHSKLSVETCKISTKPIIWMENCMQCEIKIISRLTEMSGLRFTFCNAVQIAKGEKKRGHREELEQPAVINQKPLAWYWHT